MSIFIRFALWPRCLKTSRPSSQQVPLDFQLHTTVRHFHSGSEVFMRRSFAVMGEINVITLKTNGHHSFLLCFDFVQLIELKKPFPP